MDHYGNTSSLLNWKIEQILRIKSLKNIMILLYFLLILMNDTRYPKIEIGKFLINVGWIHEPTLKEPWKSFSEIDYMALKSHISSCFYRIFLQSCKARTKVFGTLSKRVILGTRLIFSKRKCLSNHRCKLIGYHEISTGKILNLNLF